MIIRTETPADHEAIRHVIKAAFNQSDEADLVDAVRASGDGAVSLVAERNHVIVGHILISRLIRPERCLALAPLSVHPDHQRTGIGTQLMEHAFEKLREADWKVVFVLGRPNYYRRVGFSIRAAEKFITVYPKQYFMALEVHEGALENLSGAVVYPDPFLELD